MDQQGHGRMKSWPNLRSYPGILFEGLSKPTTILSQDRRVPAEIQINLGYGKFDDKGTFKNGKDPSKCATAAEHHSSCETFSLILKYLLDIVHTFHKQA
jgi:hypothetical protein